MVVRHSDGTWKFCDDDSGTFPMDSRAPQACLGPPSGRGSPPGASAAFSRLLPSLPDSSLCAVSFFLTQPEMACVVEEPPCFLQPETKEQVQGTPGCDQSLLGPGSGSLVPNNHRLRGHLSFLRMPFSSWSQVSTPMERATLQSPDVPAFVGHVPRHGPCPALTHRRAEGWSARSGSADLSRDSFRLS